MEKWVSLQKNGKDESRQKPLVFDVELVWVVKHAQHSKLVGLYSKSM